MTVKVFVAGSNGLVGNSIVRNAPQGITIITADRRQLDLRDQNKVNQFLKEKMPDLVIICAAKVGGILANSLNRREFLVENMNLQNAIINCSANTGIKNLIFLGSSCVYPKYAPQPISENSLLTGLLEPTNEGYALSKIVGIKLCEYIYDETGLNYFSVMPTNLYGPGDNFDYENSHVPAAFIRKFHEAKTSNLQEVIVWGTGEPIREFMHVDDLASAIWFLSQNYRGGELINVGSGVEISISEFSTLVAKVVDYRGRISFDESKPDGTPRKLMDSSKINGMGWFPSIELEQGLRSTYEWYLKALEKGEVRGVKA